MASYVLFQPSTGGFVAQFVPMDKGQYHLGFVEIAADAVHGTKKVLSEMLSTIELYRPALAETLMLVRTD